MSQVIDRQITETVTTDSSCVRKASYCAAERTLDITFPSGQVYRYFNVPLDVWLHFGLTSDIDQSLGRYYNRWIRDQYDFVQLGREEPDNALGDETADERRAAREPELAAAD